MVEAKHNLLVGDSGSGKTTLLREVHNEAEGPSIFLNYSIEGKRTKGVAGQRAGSKSGAFSTLQNAESWGDVRINYQASGDLYGQMWDCMDVIRDIFESAHTPVQLCVPECHRVIPDNGETVSECPGKYALDEGRDDGVKLVGDTQTPKKLDYDSITNVVWMAWCGEVQGFHDGFMNAHGWIEEDKLPGDDYEYVVMDKKGNVRWRDETDPRYGDGR